MPFSIVSCPRCVCIQTMEIRAIERAVLRCVACGKQTKVRKHDGTVIQVHGVYDHPAVASRVCAQLKEEVFKSKK